MSLSLLRAKPAANLDSSFLIARNVEKPHSLAMKHKPAAAKTKTFANRFSAIGAEPRLRILQSLIVAPEGQRTVGEIQEEIGIPWSTLSHHLEKLRHEELVTTRRDGSFLWYKANAKVLTEMLGFLSTDCQALNGR
jgi:DNA-binding transcriptional ArsR family regulator